MQGSVIETLIGAVVLAVAGVFLVFAYDKAGIAKIEGYELVARFQKIDGINIGSDVVMSGIKIGSVVAQELDAKEFQAVLTISVQEGLVLPTDSTIKVTQTGLLGDQYLSIEAGGSDENLKPGGEFEFTQGSVDLIELVGKAMYSGGGAGGRQ